MVMNDDIPSQAFPTIPVATATADRRGGEGRPDIFRWRYAGAKPASSATTPADVSSLLGMPLGAIPKPVLDKVAELVDEVELLRAELSQARHHVHWLEDLRTEHRDLDDVIERLADSGTYDQLQLKRLKKRKLMLKDQMIAIESALLPDIIA